MRGFKDITLEEKKHYARCVIVVEEAINYIHSNADIGAILKEYLGINPNPACISSMVNKKNHGVQVKYEEVKASITEELKSQILSETAEIIEKRSPSYRTAQTVQMIQNSIGSYMSSTTAEERAEAFRELQEKEDMDELSKNLALSMFAMFS